VVIAVTVVVVVVVVVIVTPAAVVVVVPAATVVAAAAPAGETVVAVETVRVEAPQRVPEFTGAPLRERARRRLSHRSCP
jgi:hypothetical protein